MQSSYNHRLFRKNGRAIKPKESLVGKVLFYDKVHYEEEERQNRPFVCIKYRGNYIWQDFRDLSNGKFGENRERISENLKDVFKNYRHEINKHNITKRKLISSYARNTEMFAYFYNKMDMFERKKFTETFPDELPKFSNLICPLCDNISTKPLVTCRHDDCTKMCEGCAHQWKSGTQIVNNTFIFGHISCDSGPVPSASSSAGGTEFNTLPSVGRSVAFSRRLKERRRA